jgi:hypothetical protein
LIVNLLNINKKKLYRIKKIFIQLIWPVIFTEGFSGYRAVRPAATVYAAKPVEPDLGPDICSRPSGTQTRITTGGAVPEQNKR